MCSIPYENPATNVFTMPSFCTLKRSSVKFLVALPSLIYVKISAHLYNQYPPYGYDRHKMTIPSA